MTAATSPSMSHMGACPRRRQIVLHGWCKSLSSLWMAFAWTCHVKASLLREGMQFCHISKATDPLFKNKSIPPMISVIHLEVFDQAVLCFSVLLAFCGTSNAGVCYQNLVPKFRVNVTEYLWIMNFEFIIVIAQKIWSLSTVLLQSKVCRQVHDLCNQLTQVEFKISDICNKFHLNKTGNCSQKIIQWMVENNEPIFKSPESLPYQSLKKMVKVLYCALQLH